ncbi:hypothetical protein IFM89_018748 [Coptis chinensis]|uniref:Uncharacterized protein n=1 Tax=Coptis chinensis TaxID=261450 RepID=A0A835HL15_9MAGN|nr:hypothetical protein IFM89_018748 [Coptis chinensis]
MMNLWRFVDKVKEEIRLGLELSDYSFQRKTHCTYVFLGELYNYEHIDSSLFLKHYIDSRFWPWDIGGMKLDEGEGLKPNKKKRKCSKCKVEGHNAKTCKGLAVEKNGRAKGKKKDRQAAPSQASATQVAAPSQASTTQVVAPSHASTT